MERSRTDSTLRWTALLALFGLLVEFLLGMAVNLFVTIPRSHPGANPGKYFGGSAQSVSWAILRAPSWLLVVHASVGLVLVVAAFGLLVMAMARRQRRWVLVMLGGLIGVMAAGFNGASFLDFHEDIRSILMSVGLRCRRCLIRGGNQGRSLTHGRRPPRAHRRRI